MSSLLWRSPDACCTWEGSPGQKSESLPGLAVSSEAFLCVVSVLGPPIRVLVSPIVHYAQSCYVPGTALKAGDVTVSRTGTVFSWSFPSYRKSDSEQER